MEDKQYMHEWLKEDAVEYDLPAEEVIQQLANDNTDLQDENERLKKLIRKKSKLIKKLEQNTKRERQIIELNGNLVGPERRIP